MALIALKCPNCGGTVQMEDNMKQGFCIHCGSRIMNQPAGTDKRSEVVNYLKMAKDALQAKNWTEAAKIVNKIFDIDYDCRDAWYMSAMWSYGNEAAYKEVIGKTESRPMNDYGIFSIDEIKKFWGEFDLRIKIVGSGHPNYFAFVTIDGRDSRLIRRNVTSVIGIDSGEHTLEAGPTIIGAKEDVTDKITFTVTKDTEIELELVGLLSKKPKVKIKLIK